MSIHVLGISGSLRRASYNTGLLRAASELLPDGMTLEIYDLSSIPLYNQDIADIAFPEPVKHFKERIRAADALLIATPEYNYSVTGVLKNAIDWASRPPQENAWNDKPLAIVGAGGLGGTARAQLALRHIAVFVNMHVVNKPELRVVRSWEKFDKEGNLTDEAVRKELRALLEALAAWTRRLRGER